MNCYVYFGADFKNIVVAMVTDGKAPNLKPSISYKTHPFYFTALHGIHACASMAGLVNYIKL